MSSIPHSHSDVFVLHRSGATRPRALPRFLVDAWSFLVATSLLTLILHITFGLIGYVMIERARVGVETEEGRLTSVRGSLDELSADIVRLRSATVNDSWAAVNRYGASYAMAGNEIAEE